MREFNTSGPCNPALHYTVLREALMEEGQTLVDKGQFITLFAPRQSGKTTYFQLLLERLNQQAYTAIWISFESLKTVSRQAFYDDLDHRLRRELTPDSLASTPTIKDHLSLRHFFERLQSKPLILIIDEFEGIPDEVLGEVMHTFREIYHQKQHYRLHALMLVGVSTIAELIIGPASPFNIADQLEIGYFTHTEVDGLIQQYVTESGRMFDAAVIKAIYDNTQGQPGLVCALCQHLVTKAVPDPSQPMTMDAFYPTLQYFLTRRQDKNIVNIVQKAKQKRRFILKLLFGNQPIPFTVDDEEISWLHANGVVAEIDGYVGMNVPLYAKRLITAFRPLINGEAEHYLTTSRDLLGDYLLPDRRLNLNALLESYRAYIQRRGFRAFDTENLKEGAWHYSLDGYLTFFIEQLGGQTFVEVPAGRGRTDILIRYRDESYIIETKVFRRVTDFKRGKAQLAAYLESERLVEGYYVVFSKNHTKDDLLYTVDTIAGKQIHTHIIRTAFERPSEIGVPTALKRNA